ncbi:MAG: T9SS type A sorting domain-containing protein, partial [Ignavibacteriaceae bacterium]|nr:T9SS type A sorting domain-containing protein [Ignavibacteriaceae bacterium]
DFHLQMYSPAIDAGDPAILDVDGTRSDIGAYGGPGGEKYDYLDLAPRQPSGLTANIFSDTILTVRWKINTERDFIHYKIYSDTVHSFVPDSSNLIAVQKANSFSQAVPNNIHTLYFRVSAVDSQGNESKPSEELGVIITSVEDNTISLLQDYHLYQNYPNPFNSSTVIPFTLKDAGYVKIALFDITGELVGYALNEYKSAGYNEIKFDADSFGKSKLTSGIYLYRIEVISAGGIPSYSDIKKMVLIK